MKLTKIHLTTLFILIVVVLSAYLIMVKKMYPYQELSLAVKQVIRASNILYYGEDFIIKKKIDTQLSREVENKIKTKIIETAYLPLKLESVSVAGAEGLPSAGGAITVAEGKLIVLDRFGGIYLYQDKKLNRLNYGKFPNNIEQYILNSDYPIFNENTMRAHSIAYDKELGRLYVAHTKFINEGINRFVISHIQVNRSTMNAIGKWETLYESDDIPSNHASHAGGGKIIINKNILHFSTGYAKQKIVNGKVISNAQDPKLSFGKVYEIDLRTKTIHQKALGFRNPQGMTMTNDGHLLSVEHGPQGGDEVNLIENGNNYGWPFETYGTRYGTYNYNWPPGSTPEFQEYTAPFFSFVPSVATSSIFSIKDFHPAWENNIIIGSLKAQSLFRLKLIGTRVVYSEPIWIGHRIRDITQINKEIVLLTDDSFLIFISVDDKLLMKNSKNAGYNFEPKLKQCLVCHHFEQSNPSSMAPSLLNILNRKIASDTFTKYSDGLKNKGGKWNRDALIDFIENPSKFSPGTTMPNLGLSRKEVGDIVEIISK